MRDPAPSGHCTGGKGGCDMQAFVAAGAGFLVAVLWFDLMFDVQTRGHRGDTIPVEILDSISAYYRRVTTEARPMGLLVALIMGLTLLAIIAEIGAGADPWWIGWISLAVTTGAVGLTRLHTVPNAVQLGSAKDPLDVRTRLARALYRDHCYCFAAMSLVVILQLAAAL
jgi:hypothetical protein